MPQVASWQAAGGGGRDGGAGGDEGGLGEGGGVEGGGAASERDVQVLRARAEMGAQEGRRT